MPWRQCGWHTRRAVHRASCRVVVVEASQLEALKQGECRVSALTRWPIVSDDKKEDTTLWLQLCASKKAAQVLFVAPRAGECQLRDRWLGRASTAHESRIAIEVRNDYGGFLHVDRQRRERKRRQGGCVGRSLLGKSLGRGSVRRRRLVRLAQRIGERRPRLIRHTPPLRWHLEHAAPLALELDRHLRHRPGAYAPLKRPVCESLFVGMVIEKAHPRRLVEAVELNQLHVLWAERHRRRRAGAAGVAPAFRGSGFVEKRQRLWCECKVAGVPAVDLAEEGRALEAASHVRLVELDKCFRDRAAAR
mmetsp:Transcript_17134/g.43085  ORF Transcript_17134/g.43085 Transcript_17134/m.43085 type:complete len:305 (+) Transcript_17134:589-1503(+)